MTTDHFSERNWLLVGGSGRTGQSCPVQTGNLGRVNDVVTCRRAKMTDATEFAGEIS